jgi:hypothetical protein
MACFWGAETELYNIYISFVLPSITVLIKAMRHATQSFGYIYFSVSRISTIAAYIDN